MVHPVHNEVLVFGEGVDAVGLDHVEWASGIGGVAVVAFAFGDVVDARFGVD